MGSMVDLTMIPPTTRTRWSIKVVFRMMTCNASIILTLGHLIRLITELITKIWMSNRGKNSDGGYKEEIERKMMTRT